MTDAAGPHRFRELDGLRGLAALAVVLSHLTVAYDTLDAGAPDPAFTARWGGFGVQLFFLISGYVILMSARRSTRPSDFVISRVSRLYPVYWMGLAVSTLIATTWALWPTPSLTTVLGNLTMVQRWFFVDNVDPVYWTLAVEMQFYVMVLLLLLLTRCRLSREAILTAVSVWVAVGIVVAIVVGSASRGIDPQLVATPQKILLNLTLAEFAPLFAAGTTAFLARSGELTRWWTLGFSAIAVTQALLLRDTFVAGAVAVVCLVFQVVVARERTGILLIRPIQWLGLISYSLYIGHALLGDLVTWTLIPHLGRDLAMLAALVVVLAFASVLHRVGERRASAWFKAWLLRLRARRDARVSTVGTS